MCLPKLITWSRNFITTPRKSVQCDIWLLAWKRCQGDLEPRACEFQVCVRRGSVWRTEASGSCLLPLYSATTRPRFTALRSQRSQKGRQGWFSPGLPLMTSACVDKDSITNVCCGTHLVHGSPQTLTPPHSSSKESLASPSPASVFPPPHVHLSILLTPPSVSNCFPSPRERCGFEMMVFNHFLSDQPRNHFLVPHTQIKS